MATTYVFDIADLKPEALYAVIKTALLSNLEERLALLCPFYSTSQKKLQLLWVWYTLQSGYNASTASTWARKVHKRGKLLEPHKDATTCINAQQGNAQEAQGASPPGCIKELTTKPCSTISPR
jgi:hypothetical protein